MKYPRPARSLSLILLLLLLAAGCRGAKTPKTPAVAPPAEAQQQAAVAPPAPASTTAEPEAAETPEASAPDSAQDDPASADSPEVAAAPEAAPSEEPAEKEPAAEAAPEPSEVEDESVPGERLLLFMPDGPLLVELLMTIDDEPFHQALEQLVDDVLRAGDSDGDGQTTWEEITTSRRFTYGQFGNVVIDDSTNRRQIIRQYDFDADGNVDRNEVPRFLTQNRGSTRTFSLGSSNEFSGDNRSRSLVRRTLDADEDGAISPDEMQLAAVRLRSRDADEDDVLYVDDFKSELDLGPAAMRRRTRRYGPDIAMLLEANINWDDLLFSLAELYAGGGTIGPDSFALLPGLFTQLDANENRELESDELPRLKTIEPHIVLEANFGRQAKDSGPREKLALKSLSAELDALGTRVSQFPGRLNIGLADTPITFYVNDSLPAENYEAQAQAQLNNLDADKNGYLEETELPADNAGLPASFEAVDADADRKLYLDEIVSFLAQQQAAMRSQLQARVGNHEDALFTVLDADSDGRLTSREIEGAAGRLKSLDRNDDGLSTREIPGSLVMGMARGNPQLGDALFVMPAAAESNLPSSSPTWFLRMDANRDGEISHDEFLGDAAQFSQLDGNGDGFLDPAEARAPQSEPLSPPP